MPPCSIEAEEALLGALMIQPDLLEDIQPILPANPFFREAHAWIYDAMLTLPSDKINQVSVQEALKKAGKLEAIGGASVLSDLIARCPGTVGVSVHWANIIRDKAFQRALITAGIDISKAGYEGKDDIDELYRKCLGRLTDIEAPSTRQILTGKEYAEAMLTMLSRRRSHEVRTFPYGYAALDSKLGGIMPSELIILGSAPRVAKTTLLWEITLHNLPRGNPVFFCSAEMSIEQISERHVQTAIGLPIVNIRHGLIDEEEWEQCQTLVGEVAEMPIFFLMGQQSTTNIIIRAKELHKRFGLSMVMVDYLQLLTDRYDRRAGDSLHQRIGYATAVLKELAKSLNIPVLAASILKRGETSSAKDYPKLSDLKESGDIEAHADVVLLLHRRELYRDALPSDLGILEVSIAKSRQIGNSGDYVKLRWNSKRRHYENLPDDEGLRGWREISTPLASVAPPPPPEDTNPSTTIRMGI